MSNKQIAALMAVRAFAGTNTVSADNNFADGVAAANRHVINHIDYLITQVQAGHEVPFVVEHESRFPFQGKVTSEPQPTDRHALQAEGRHPAPCARFCEANAFQIEIRQLSAQLEQADRQRVPEGYVLVPVEPTDEMVDAACDKSDFFRVDFVLAWDAAINASPELTQSATSHTHKVVPVTPTKEMLISGARAPVELLSPDGALQVYRAMLAAAPEAPGHVPLTRHQVEHLRQNLDSAGSFDSLQWHEDFARAIERAHGIAAAPEAPAQDRTPVKPVREKPRFGPYDDDDDTSHLMGD